MPAIGDRRTNRNRIAHRIHAAPILLACLTLLAASAIAAEPASSGDAGKASSPEQSDGAKDVYSKPPAFKTFSVAGHRFKVPREYSQGPQTIPHSFQIVAYWPTLGRTVPTSINLETAKTLTFCRSRLRSFAITTTTESSWSTVLRGRKQRCPIRKNRLSARVNQSKLKAPTPLWG